MYLRHCEDGRVSYIPEDDRVPGTSAMAGSMRGLDPPQRKPWMARITHNARADALLRQYLCERIENYGDSREKGVLRTFLKRVGAAKAAGAPEGIELAIRKGQQPNTFEVYANVHGRGRVEALPMVSMQANDKLSRIFRETGPIRVPVTGEPTVTAPGNPSEERRFVVPPKAETTLIPGRRA
jgi:hypothetical protein